MSEQYVDVGDATLWTTRSGQGALPVILINGGPGCDDYLQPVAAALHDLCDVVRFEPRGCGRSSWDGQYDLKTTLSDLDAVRQHYQFSQVLLIGHSFGPDIGLMYVVQQPQHVLGLIGLAGGRIVNDRDWHAAYSEGKPHEAVLPFNADELVNKIGNQDYKAYIKRPQLLRDIKGISCPVRYIAGQQDIRPNWPIQQLAGLIPDGKYFEIEGADHYLWNKTPLFEQCLHAVVLETYL